MNSTTAYHTCIQFKNNNVELHLLVNENSWCLLKDIFMPLFILSLLGFFSVGLVTMKIFSYKGTSAHMFCITDFITQGCHTNVCKSCGLFCPGLVFPVEGRQMCKLIIVVGPKELLCLARSDWGKARVAWCFGFPGGGRIRCEFPSTGKLPDM